METIEFDDLKISLRMLRDIVARRAVHMRIVTRTLESTEGKSFVYDIEISDLPPPLNKKDNWQDAVSFNFDSPNIGPIHKILIFTALIFTYDGIDVYVDGKLFDPDAIARQAIAEKE